MGASWPEVIRQEQLYLQDAALTVKLFGRCSVLLNALIVLLLHFDMFILYHLTYLWKSVCSSLSASIELTEEFF